MITRHFASVAVCLIDVCWGKFHKDYDEIYVLIKPTPQKGDFETEIYDGDLAGALIDMREKRIEVHHRDLAIPHFHHRQKEARRLGRAYMYQL